MKVTRRKTNDPVKFMYCETTSGRRFATLARLIDEFCNNSDDVTLLGESDKVVRKIERKKGVYFVSIRERGAHK